MHTNAPPLPAPAETLLDQAPDALIFADPAGIIRVWNKAAARIFGHPASAALGANLDIIIPERLRSAHAKGFEHALAARATKYAGQSLPTRAVHADGSQIYVELSFAIILAADGSPLGSLAQARDITERFARETAARQRLQELERTLAQKT